MSVLLWLGCARSASAPAPLASRAQGRPEILAAYQPWFGAAGHIDVGYSSQDRTVLARQILHARQRGIRGFVVNWYGPGHGFEDHAFALLSELAASDSEGFRVALMYDESESAAGDPTEAALSDLDYARRHYLDAASPLARGYLRYQGRPVIFIFPKDGRTDWNRVRQVVSVWPEPPLLLYKDPSERWAQAFDGFYAWVQPGAPGWQPDGSNWGESYLNGFYQTMRQRYPGKLVVGGAWPGFDDRRASWSQNRRMDSRCGRTLAESMKVFERYYDGEHPLPFLMIETWNDYEEGTNIEDGGRCTATKAGSGV